MASGTINTNTVPRASGAGIIDAFGHWYIWIVIVVLIGLALVAYMKLRGK